MTALYLSGGVICLSSYLLASWEFSPCQLAITGARFRDINRISELILILTLID